MTNCQHGIFNYNKIGRNQSMCDLSLSDMPIRRLLRPPGREWAYSQPQPTGSKPDPVIRQPLWNIFHVNCRTDLSVNQVN